MLIYVEINAIDLTFLNLDIVLREEVDHRISNENQQTQVVETTDPEIIDVVFETFEQNLSHSVNQVPHLHDLRQQTEHISILSDFNTNVASQNQRNSHSFSALEMNMTIGQDLVVSVISHDPVVAAIDNDPVVATTDQDPVVEAIDHDTVVAAIENKTIRLTDSIEDQATLLESAEKLNSAETLSPKPQDNSPIETPVTINFTEVATQSEPEPPTQNKPESPTQNEHEPPTQSESEPPIQSESKPLTQSEPEPIEVTPHRPSSRSQTVKSRLTLDNIQSPKINNEQHNISAKENDGLPHTEIAISGESSSCPVQYDLDLQQVIESMPNSFVSTSLNIGELPNDAILSPKKSIEMHTEVIQDTSDLIQNKIQFDQDSSILPPIVTELNIPETKELEENTDLSQAGSILVANSSEPVIEQPIKATRKNVARKAPSKAKNTKVESSTKVETSTEDTSDSSIKPAKAPIRKRNTKVVESPIVEDESLNTNPAPIKRSKRQAAKQAANETAQDIEIIDTEVAPIEKKARRKGPAKKNKKGYVYELIPDNDIIEDYISEHESAEDYIPEYNISKLANPAPDSRTAGRKRRTAAINVSYTQVDDSDSSSEDEMPKPKRDRKISLKAKESKKCIAESSEVVQKKSKSTQEKLKSTDAPIVRPKRATKTKEPKETSPIDTVFVDTNNEVKETEIAESNTVKDDEQNNEQEKKIEMLLQSRESKLVDADFKVSLILSVSF